MITVFDLEEMAGAELETGSRVLTSHLNTTVVEFTLTFDSSTKRSATFSIPATLGDGHSRFRPTVLKVFKLQ
jgi:hypothetical protein